MNKLEDEFREMCKQSNCSEHWHIYQAVKSRLEKSYFPYTHDALPYFTDHGIGHVNRILEKLYTFLIPHLPFQNVPKDMYLDVENLNVLINATLWHDIGNLYDREEHEKRMMDIFAGVKGFLYDEYVAEWIEKIARAHYGPQAIDHVIDRRIVPVHDTMLFPQFLAALLRISDEMEEDSRRAENRIIPTAPKGCEAFWKFCLANESIAPSYDKGTFPSGTVTSLRIKIFAKLDQADIWAGWCKKDKTVKGIEEYVARVEKLNNERRYCNEFLGQGQTIYFRMIDGIDLHLNVYDREKAIDSIDFVFDDRQGSEAFFNDNKVQVTLDKYK